MSSNGVPQQLAPVVTVDPEKCVNCHACIAACPVKDCNRVVLEHDGIGEHVEVVADLCIGCGACIKACEDGDHSARQYVDDWDRFERDVIRGDADVFAIIAPAAASSFPDHYLSIVTWLRGIGAKRVLDVSFGAELTVRSYLEHIRTAEPECVIAQPCPALVSYVELDRPELLQHLAPAHSPMMHTILYARKRFPELNESTPVVISPCIAKKREFDECLGVGNYYNVTCKSLAAWFLTHPEVLDLRPSEFDGRPASNRAARSSGHGAKDAQDRGTRSGLRLPGCPARVDIRRV